MIPVIALVGRPNVGKSTLFNRLTHTQDALVADFPGLTRDRNYGSASFEGKPFIVIDTGGLGVEDLAIDSLMSEQTAMALNEATQILFLVDARTGLTSLDQTVSQQLRKLNKPVYLVVNKTEDLDEEVVCADFQTLGFKAVNPIAAAHGKGIQQLLTQLTADFKPQVEEDCDNSVIKIAFVGRPNVGKSTLINRILGEERVVVYDMPGTTRDSILVPFERDNKKYQLIDTAGVRKRGRVNEKIEKFSVVKTLQAVKSAHVCLILLDAQEGLAEQDMHLLSFIIEAGKALVVAVNKWDGLSEDHKERVRVELNRRLNFVSFAKTRFISALHGSGVGLLFKDIEQAYGSSMQPLSTPVLTRLLQEIVTKHTPPLVGGRRIKLRYAHAGGHNPPLIIIHGNQLEKLPSSYKRYLNNALITQLGLVGTPVKIEFKTGSNPYKGKKNKLTPKQIKKRKRLIRHIKR